MEHREPPRMATAGDPSRDMGDDPGRARRFPRFVAPPSVRRLSRSRIVLALVAAGVSLYLLSWAGLLGLRSLRTFVHGQPEYQLNFSEIKLEPAPPAWFRGGAKGFLQRVRNGSDHPERFSVLDLDLEQLELAFKRDGWVREVIEITRANPNRVVVRLDYREPVALVKVENGKRATRNVKSVLVDRDAVILGQDQDDLEVDLKLAAPLDLERYNRATQKFDHSPPYDLEVGHTWKTPSGRDGSPEYDELVLAGAKLAAALKKAQAEDRANRRPTLDLTILVETKERLWVQSGKKWRVFWGLPPGSKEETGQSTAAKWKILRDWAEQNSESTNGLEHYEFNQGRIRKLDGPRGG